MNISLWMIGKTNSNEFKVWENDFLKRINGFINFNIEVIDNIKNIKEPEVLKLEEGKKVLVKIRKDDLLILLDDNGKSYSSSLFAMYMEKLLSQGGSKRIIFLIGGAFGFHDNIYERSNAKISLSAMTFSHQLIRIIFMEQLYRAFTIINHHPYHNQ